MRVRSSLLSIFLVLTTLVCVAGRAVAELLTALFPDGVPAYDMGDGVTVETRLHPEQMPLGVREGAFVVSPRLDESVGYTSNALPGPYRRGSWELATAPALGIASDWSRDSLGALLSLEDTRYLGLPGQDRVDGTASVGGRINIGDDTLTLGAARLAQHEDRGAIGTIPSDRPIAYLVDNVRAAYTIMRDRWTIEPAMDVANWTYGATTIEGVPASEAYRDRVVAQGGVTVRYSLAPLRSLVLVVRGIDQAYTRTPFGQVSPDSTSYQLLGGIDYDDDAVWRWRVLVGGEARLFASSKYSQQNTVIAEAGVTWMPSGLTTVSAVISRETGDAEQADVSGLIYSSALLTIDHEYLRNLLFHASFGLQRGDFFGGGYEVGVTAGAGLTWVLNRSVRMAFTYDQTDLRGSEPLVTGYSRGVGLVTLRLGL